MCGRFTQKNTAKEFSEHVYGFKGDAKFERRHNIKPTQTVAIVISCDGEEIETVEARWWLQKLGAKSFSTDFSTFNARTDKLESSFLYKPALEHRRCLVPVSSYYEWAKKGEPPFEFSVQNKPFALAGLWNNWFEDGAPKLSFTIITTEANEFAGKYHNRMPVILSDMRKQEAWLTTGGMDLLIPFEHQIKTAQLPDKIEALING